MCLDGTVVASWCLTQEMADLSTFTVMTNILSLNSVKPLRENSINTQTYGLYKSANNKEINKFIFVCVYILKICLMKNQEKKYLHQFF